MPEAPPAARVMIFGGAGVFGSLVAEEALRLGLPVTIAGRNRERTAAKATQIGCDFAQVDIRDAAACRTALIDFGVEIGRAHV